MVQSHQRKLGLEFVCFETDLAERITEGAGSKIRLPGTSLVVQQLRSHASYAEGAGWIPGQGAKIHMLRITAKGKDSVPQSFVYLLFFSLLLDIQMHIQMTLF